MNKMWGIEDTQGKWMTEFCRYFAKLFFTFNPTQDQIEEALIGMIPKVSP